MEVAAVLYLPLQEGLAAVLTGPGEPSDELFRPASGTSCFTMVTCAWRDVLPVQLLRKAGGLGLDWQLFLMDIKGASTAGLPEYYSSMLRARSDVLTVQRGTLWGLEEPLFHNPLLGLSPQVQASLKGLFVRAGITKLAHLWSLADSGWRDAADIAAQVGVHSWRQVVSILVEVRATLPALLDEDGAASEPLRSPPSLCSHQGGIGRRNRGGF